MTFQQNKPKSENSENGDNGTTTFRIPNKLIIWMLIAALGGGMGTNLIPDVFGNNGIPRQEYQTDRILDSIKLYHWKKDVQEDIDTLINSNRRIEHLLNQKGRK